MSFPFSIWDLHRPHVFDASQGLRLAVVKEITARRPSVFAELAIKITARV